MPSDLVQAKVIAFRRQNSNGTSTRLRLRTPNAQGLWQIETTTPPVREILAEFEDHDSALAWFKAGQYKRER